ncbi:hypothetical protein DL764_005516 [Monosporascus ibericus]|uniref:Uncharacterized protein n=1 Tax=Monosporascus ibericus TaxID=155417 RepID=A0A4Q4TBT5_9PEZI|nr:hypothetical protein DL764_005516 [Monosporascus ibericus]
MRDMSHTADGLGGSPRNGSGPCTYEKPPALSLAEETSTQPESSQASMIGGESAKMLPDGRLRERPALPSFGSSAGLHLDISAPRRVIDLRADPVAQHNAHFLLQAMRGLPLMVARQETLPWFIHVSVFETSRVPETMAKCVGISNLYLERQPHHRKDSLWPVVDVENKRFLRRVQEGSKEELLLGKQVQILYTVMCTLDNISELGIPEIRLQTLMTFQLYCQRLQYIEEHLSLAGDSLGDLEETWRDWVTAIIWFLLSRIADLKFGVLCRSVKAYRAMALPAPGPLWNARTPDEWKAARDRYYSRDAGGRPLRTFGDLIDARSQPPNSELGLRLNEWYASCDNLGLLLTLATTMI